MASVLDRLLGRGPYRTKEEIARMRKSNEDAYRRRLERLGYEAEQRRAAEAHGNVHAVPGREGAATTPDIPGRSPSPSDHDTEE